MGPEAFGGDGGGSKKTQGIWGGESQGVSRRVSGKTGKWNDHLRPDSQKGPLHATPQILGPLCEELIYGSRVDNKNLVGGSLELERISEVLNDKASPNPNWKHRLG